MLGEILGRRAGETWTELTLARFLLPRAVINGVFLVPELGPGNSCGLWVTEAAVIGFVNIGDGSGARPGVLVRLVS